MHALFLCIAFGFIISLIQMSNTNQRELIIQSLKSKPYRNQIHSVITLTFDRGQLWELLWAHSYNYLIKTVRK
jgi:hypothetical protein